MTRSSACSLTTISEIRSTESVACFQLFDESNFFGESKRFVKSSEYDVSSCTMLVHDSSVKFVTSLEASCATLDAFTNVERFLGV